MQNKVYLIQIHYLILDQYEIIIQNLYVLPDISCNNFFFTVIHSTAKLSKDVTHFIKQFAKMVVMEAMVTVDMVPLDKPVQVSLVNIATLKPNVIEPQ